MISWDFAANLSTPRKTLEKMQEHFAATLGHNSYLFGIVHEMNSKQYIVLYDEEKPIGRTDIMARMVYFCMHVVPRWACTDGRTVRRIGRQL